MAWSLLRKSIIAFVLAGLIAACGIQQQPVAPTPSPVPPSTATATATLVIQQSANILDPSTQATLRFIVAVPDAPRLDIYVGDNLAVGQLGYGLVSSSISRAAGKYAIRVTQSGKRPADGGILLEQGIDLIGRDLILGVITGTKDKLEWAQITENTDAVNAQQARFQVAYAMQDKAEVGLSIDGKNPIKLKTAGQTSDSLTVEAGKHDLKLESNGQPLLTQSLMLGERQSYTLVLTGAANNTAKIVAANSPTIRETRLRIIDASADAGQIDVYLNENQVAKGLDYGKFTDWQKVPVRPSELRVLKAGAAANSTPILKTSILLNADQSGDIVIYGPAATLQGRVFWETLRPTGLNTARLMVVNAARGTNAIQAVSAETPFSGLSLIRYGDISTSASIPQGQLQVKFNAAGENTPRTIEAPSLDLKEGMAYLYIVTGDAQSGLLLSTKVGMNTESAVLSGSGTVQPATAAPTFIVSTAIQFRVINATADIPSLDAYAVNAPKTRATAAATAEALAKDSVPVINGVARGHRSVSAAIEKGGTVIITQAGSNQPLTSVKLSVQPSKPVALIIVGQLTNKVKVFQVVDETRTLTDKAVVQVIHAADFWRTPERVSFEAALLTTAIPASKSAAQPPLPTVTGGSVIARLKRGGVSSAMVLDPGVYTFLGRNEDEGRLVFVDLPGVTLTKGGYHILSLLETPGKGQMVLVGIEN